MGIDPGQLVRDVAKSIAGLATRPSRVVAELRRTGTELGQILAGQSRLAPSDGDKRFADSAWIENPIYNRLMQGYLALTGAGHRLVDQGGLNELDRQRAHFAVTLLADALAPTNGLITNPAAIKRAFDTAGQSLGRGARHFARDIRENRAMPQTVDKRPFKIGQNVAASPGAVVYRN
ncbi:MAG TPA: hypothetical protein VNA65_02755, partial [Candidatus Dormibacteraeota bacterium]|nr:hypothetical protein [Candidatus Dormibacteraeota bacterium]